VGQRAVEGGRGERAEHLAGTGIQAAHVAIDVMIGDSDAVVLGIPSAPAEQIAPVYWDPHTNRDDTERVFTI
jgi:hypothetical protein